MKLTDTQLIILSKASQREDRAVELPASLKGGAAQKVVAKLLEAGLLEELEARGGLTAWRRDAEERPLALRITKRGMMAIRADAEDHTARAKSVSVGTLTGGTDILLSAGPTRPRRSGKAGKEQGGGDATAPVGVSDKASDQPAEAALRTGSKQALVIALLHRDGGATGDDLVAATGWLPHTARAALTGLRHKGFAIATTKNDAGKTVYRIDAGAAPVGVITPAPESVGEEVAA